MTKSLRYTVFLTLRKTSNTSCPAPVLIQLKASVDGLDVAEDTSYASLRIRNEVNLV
jgi:hypothetical protein